MCFFDQYRLACRDWRWGKSCQHYAREYRMGETCGLKLVMQTIPEQHKCKSCEKIDIKIRHRTAEVDRTGRWQRESCRSRASIDKIMDIIRSLDGEIYALSCERLRRLQTIELIEQDPESVATDEHHRKYPGMLAGHTKEDVRAIYADSLSDVEQSHLNESAPAYSIAYLHESYNTAIEASDSGYRSADYPEAVSTLPAPAAHP